MDKLKNYNDERLKDLKEKQETEISKIEVEKKNQVKEFELKEEQSDFLKEFEPHAIHYVFLLGFLP